MGSKIENGFLAGYDVCLLLEIKNFDHIKNIKALR
jgi:hypothetical protein